MLLDIGVRGFPARGYFIPGRDGGGLVAGKSSVSSSRVVVARPGPGPGLGHVAIKCNSWHEPIGVRGF